MTSPVASRFPIWQYLRQPVFDVNRQIEINPRRFWYSYTVEMLNRCLEIEYSSDLHQD
jgi:hypothetical protein